MDIEKQLDTILKFCDRIKKQVKECKRIIQAFEPSEGTHIVLIIDPSLSQLCNISRSLVTCEKIETSLPVLGFNLSIKQRHKPVTRTVSLKSVRRKNENDLSWISERETYVSNTPTFKRTTKSYSLPNDFQETPVEEELEYTDVESECSENEDPDTDERFSPYELETEDEETSLRGGPSYGDVGGKRPIDINVEANSCTYNRDNENGFEARNTNDNHNQANNSQPTDDSGTHDMDHGNSQKKIPEEITIGDTRQEVNYVNEEPIEQRQESKPEPDTKDKQDNSQQVNLSRNSRHDPNNAIIEPTEERKSEVDLRTDTQERQMHDERQEREHSSKGMQSLVEGTIHKHKHVTITKIGDNTYHIEGCKGRGGIVCFDEYFVIVAKDKLLKINIDDGEVKSEIICDDGAFCLCKLRTTSNRAGVLTGQYIKIINTEMRLQVVYQIEISGIYQHICHAATYEKYPDTNKPDPSYYFYAIRTVQSGPKEFTDKHFKICAIRKRIPSCSVNITFTEQQKEIELPTHVTNGIRCIESLADKKVVIATQTGIYCVIISEQKPKWTMAWNIDNEINSMFRYHKSLYLCFPKAAERRVMKVDQDGQKLSENLISGYQCVVPDYVDVDQHVLFIAGFDTTKWKIHLHRFDTS